MVADMIQIHFFPVVFISLLKEDSARVFSLQEVSINGQESRKRRLIYIESISSNIYKRHL